MDLLRHVKTDYYLYISFYLKHSLCAQGLKAYTISVLSAFSCPVLLMSLKVFLIIRAKGWLKCNRKIQCHKCQNNFPYFMAQYYNNKEQLH